MAEFAVRAEDVNRVSVPSGDFDVKDGRLDLSSVEKGLREQAERELGELVRAGVLEVAAKIKAPAKAAGQEGK